MSRFIVIEGLDGAGTTTQSKLLVCWLKEQNLRALLTREPTDGPVGRIIRAVLRGEEDVPDWHTLPWLFAADRADHVFRDVDPALSLGTWVVSDRYYHSSLAYQSLTLPLEKVAALNDFRAPDLTVFLDVPVSLCLERIQRRGGAREMFEERDRLERISESYQEVLGFLRASGETIVTVDGSADVEEVFEGVRGAVERLIG